MTNEQAKQPEELERRARGALELFPWPDDSPFRETGGMNIRSWEAAQYLRTPEQGVAENRLRDLRAALNGLVSAIYRYRQDPESE